MASIVSSDEIKEMRRYTYSDSIVQPWTFYCKCIDEVESVFIKDIDNVAHWWGFKNLSKRQEFFNDLYKNNYLRLCDINSRSEYCDKLSLDQWNSLQYYYNNFTETITSPSQYDMGTQEEVIATIRFITFLFKSVAMSDINKNSANIFFRFRHGYIHLPGSSIKIPTIGTP